MARSKDPAKEAALLDAALELVMDQGLVGLKMSDLARSAGVAIGTSYVYFKDKRQLMSSLYDHVRKRGMERYMAGYDREAPFEHCVRHIWMRYMHHALECPQDMVFLEHYRRSPFLDKDAVERSDKALDPVRELLTRGMREGEVKRIDIELMIQQLAAPINRYAVMHHAGLLRMDDARIEQAYHMAWDSMRP